MNILMILTGILAIGLVLKSASQEKWARRIKAQEKLATRLILQEPGQELQYVDLWSGHFTIGRRKRRSDLAVIHDPTVSREHCILWLDQQGRWNIRPVLHRQSLQTPAYYSQVLVGMRYVPAEGMPVDYLEEIHIGDTTLHLERRE